MSKTTNNYAPELRERAVRMVPERENRQRRQASEILRKASAYCAMAELDHPFKR